MLLARNEPDRERLEAQLSEESRALLAGKPEMGRWYPIEHYTEITALLWREEGGGGIEYLHRRGANILEKLMDAGLYQQLDYMNRQGSGTQRRATRDDILRTCRLVGSITGAVRNFGCDSWEWDADQPDCMLHHVREASHFPEVLRFVSEGAETYLVRQHRKESPPVRSERRTADHIVFTSDFSGA